MLTQTRTLRVDGSKIFTNAMVGTWARSHGRPPPSTNNKFLKFMAFTLPPPHVVTTLLWKIHSLTGTLLPIISESKNQINGGKCGTIWCCHLSRFFLTIAPSVGYELKLPVDISAPLTGNLFFCIYFAQNVNPNRGEY